jgi:hypothetical protein
MNTHDDFLGYGFSPHGREADWRDLEADLPVKGPNCPLTADLFDLALGLASGPEAARLRAHIDGDRLSDKTGCPYCRSRFEAQRRAIQRADELQDQAAVSTPLSEQIAAAFRNRGRYRRSGAVQAVKTLAADGDLVVIDQHVTLGLPDGPAETAAPLELFIQWSRPRQDEAGPGGAHRWSVTLRLPSRTADAPTGTVREDLQRLGGRQVQVTWTAPGAGHAWQVQTDLYWDVQQLVSHPEDVLIEDPGVLTHVELTLGESARGLDAS